jgi:hypothetical protein
MNYKDFDVDKFAFDEIKYEKLDVTHKFNKCSNDYNIINLKYNFDDFIILGCKMNFNKRNLKFIHDAKYFCYEFRENYVTHTINNESENFINVQIFDIDFVDFIKIYEICMYKIDKHKEQLGMPHFLCSSVKYSQATGF